MIADFTSASFLGLRHSHGELRPWERLTTGRPPALDARPERESAGAAAELLGARQAMVRRSSLHALIDIFTVSAPPGSTIAIDGAAYPIISWAAAVAAERGVHIVRYGHHDHTHAESIARNARGPVVIATDGWCSSCSRPAPLRELAHVADRRRVKVMVDDSLAIGILGDRQPAGSAFGRGGTGTAAWLGIDDPRFIVVASLAKAHGAHVAAVTGPPSFMRALSQHSTSTIHASGPTAADRAALRVAADRRAEFDAARLRLARLTRRARIVLRSHQLRPVGLPFPFVLAETDIDPLILARALRRAGSRVLVIERRCGPPNARHPAIGLAIRADHSFASIDSLDRNLARVLPTIRERVAAA